MAAMKYRKLRIVWSLGWIATCMLVLPALQPSSHGSEILRWVYWDHYWKVAVSLLLIAAIPWLPWRFSLRTLFILTTLVAVVSALVYLLQSWPTH
jgi:hypothetical protein